MGIPSNYDTDHFHSIIPFTISSINLTAYIELISSAILKHDSCDSSYTNSPIYRKNRYKTQVLFKNSLKVIKHEYNLTCLFWLFTQVLL